MNISINTLNSSYNTKFNNNQKYKSQPKFTSNVATEAAQAISETTKGKSSVFKPITDAYDKCIESIAKNFTAKIVDSRPMNYIADKFKNSGNLYQHCMTLGSLITSGLYMEKTLTNDKLDKDRKKTLAVNQGLTFVVSTAGAYSLDKYLKNWWENVTAKYVGYQLDDANFLKDFKDVKLAISEVNKGLKSNSSANVDKLAEEVKKQNTNMSETAKKYFEHAIKKAKQNADDGVKSVEKLDLKKYIDKLVGDKKIPALSKELSGKIKGMGLLRTMLVFGFVYRFFVPVVVTKPANWLCDKYLSHKKAKNAGNTQKAA